MAEATETTSTGVQLLGEENGTTARILTAEALDFVAWLHRSFNAQREALLAAREERQAEFDAGAVPDFLEETRSVRESEWRVASAPADLDDRRVEITGPTDRKMVINALNSGAQCFMADFEDALSPTWSNVVEGQASLADAIRRRVDFTSPEGKRYALAEKTATLLVRPRGWHLTEKHLRVDGEPLSASLFDAGLYLFHNAAELLTRGSGPYFYLPKLESHREARLWNDVFIAAQERLGIPRGTIRATVLIETILAAYEMDEILYELREHAAGLNAGRWDYIFSVIKKFSRREDFVLPDRAQVTMGVPFMKCYAELLVRTCHRRGAHAMGGMAAFIPNRRDAEVTEHALAKVKEDKRREAAQGFDGTWVAHPDLVPIAREEFDRVLGDRPNQKDELREDVVPGGCDLVTTGILGGQVTEEGVRNNINVALQYMEAWLAGNGAVAIHNLMEDAATAEISRAQLWQWIRHRTPLADGRAMNPDLYCQFRDEEAKALRAQRVENGRGLDQAIELLDELVLGAEFPPFLTLPAYQRLA
ncbi:MAG: malate synthase A [Gemmatimonadota bacterium]|nr:malate synthase A [Gemmatimonadota bacterium]